MVEGSAWKASLREGRWVLSCSTSLKKLVLPWQGLFLTDLFSWTIQLPLVHFVRVMAKLMFNRFKESLSIQCQDVRPMMAGGMDIPVKISMDVEVLYPGLNCPLLSRS